MPRAQQALGTRASVPQPLEPEHLDPHLRPAASIERHGGDSVFSLSQGGATAWHRNAATCCTDSVRTHHGPSQRYVRSMSYMVAEQLDNDAT
jgi:hypothetical protein